jgi:probable F420-dependent oxidoreductase
MYKIADMAVYADMLRKLWRGETITYDGPIGNFPQMKLALPCENPPPLLLGAVGPKTLALGGTHFDSVVLHPFLTTEGVTRSAAIIREAAERAGRDPAAIRISATVVMAQDTIPDETRADILDARAVSYFMHRDIGSALVAMNGWDMQPVEDLIASGVGDADFQLGGASGNRQSMASRAHLMPPEWLTTGAAVGSVETCLDRLTAYKAAGADEVLIHGAAPEEQAILADFMQARAN